MKITIKVRQHHEAKMTPEELQNHLKMKARGASVTKNGKRYIRKEKHPKGASHDN